MSERSGIMLAMPFEEKRLAKWKPPYIVQPKLDGERCRAVPLANGKYQLLSSECNEFISVPHINEALNNSGLWPMELDGELYLHGMPFEEIHSIVSRTVNLHPDYKEMEYHIFEKVDHLLPQYERLQIYTQIAPTGDSCLFPVDNIVTSSFDEVMKAYDSLIEANYEGIIVRHWSAPYVRKRSTFMMKFKPKKSDYYKIVGYKEEISIHGEPKGTLGAFICESDGNLFSVGSGLTREDRVRLWQDVDNQVGKLLHVAYQHLTSGKNIPRFPVFLEVIDEEPEEIGLKYGQ